MSDHLNHRQRQFIRFYVLHDQSTKAAIEAGYSPKCARVQGSRLLKNPKIAAELARRRKLVVGRRESERDAIRIDPDGVPRAHRDSPMSDSLSRRQRQFIHFYVSHGQIAKAAVEAGYAPKSAHVQGSRLLKNPNVAAEVERRRRLLDGREVDRDAITIAAAEQELASIAFANIADYVRIGDDGVPRLDLTNLTRRQAAALADVKVTVRTVERDGRRVLVRRVRIRLRNKLAALNRLAKLKGLFDVGKRPDES